MKLNAAAVHHFIRCFIMLGFAGLIAYLTATGDILLYVNPKLVIYLELAGAGLFIVSGFQLYISILSLKQNVIACDCGNDHEEDGDHGHLHGHEPPRSVWRNAFIYGLFVLPLLLGSLLPNKALAGALASNRGMNLAGASVSGAAPADLVELEGGADPALKSLFRTIPANRDYAKLGILLYRQDVIEMKDEWYIEKLQAMNAFADNFKGKKIKITGFVYREAGMPAAQFIVGRMAMTHCIADISPYGIIAESQDAGSYADDSWVTVTGTIDTAVFHEQKVIKINVEQIETAQAASVPYVYPDWNFASKLS